MNKNEMKVLKMNILGGMNEYIRNLNDEEVIEVWLMCGIPDGATEEDLEEIADDFDEWKEMVALFCKLTEKYVKSEKDEYITEGR